MSGTIDLLNVALSQPDISVLRIYLQHCLERRNFSKHDDAQKVVLIINSLLNERTQFGKGLMILKTLLPQCKSLIIGQNLLKWLHHCLKGLQVHSRCFDLYEVLYNMVLGHLIIYSKDFPDVRKQTSLTIVPKIMDHFFKNSYINIQIYISVACVNDILMHYGKCCGNWRKKCDTFLLSQLENSPQVVNICARCYLNVAICGPSGSDMEEYKQQWYHKHKFLIGALHSQLNDLFNNINEVEGSYEKWAFQFDRNIILQVEETCQLKRIQRLTVQFVSLTEFLREMLVGYFPASKRMHPNAIISIICRGLGVTYTTLKANVTTDSLILSTQIPTIHKACIKILDALIETCKRNLVHHGNLICKLLLQTLKWTEVKNCVYGQDKPYSELRIVVYKCLNNWLTTARRCSGVEHHIDEIIPSILSDIHFNEPTVALNVPVKRLKGKLGKKERKKNVAMSNVEDKTVSVNSLANRDVCEAALVIIPSMLESTSQVISSNIHKELQERIISELLMIQGMKKAGLELPIPYCDEGCRLALYKGLLALCNYHHPEFPPPCNYAVRVFGGGLTDWCLNIARFCGQAAANLDHILHPTGPILNFPLEINKDINSTGRVCPTKKKLLQNNEAQERPLQKKSSRNKITVEDTSEIAESISCLFVNEEGKIIAQSNNDMGIQLESIKPLEEHCNSNKKEAVDEQNIHGENSPSSVQIILEEKSGNVMQTMCTELDDIPSKENGTVNRDELINSSQKRTGVEIFECPQEKKVKESGALQNIDLSEENPNLLYIDGNKPTDISNELERQMLSTFVDKVTI